MRGPRPLENGNVDLFCTVFQFRSFSLFFSVLRPIKEHQIVDHFFPPTAGKLKDEVMTIKPVQKQSSAGQRTRFKAYVAVGDFDGHIGLGKKCSSEVATAIRGALIMAKMHLVPIRRGYWGSATASERKLRRARRFWESRRGTENARRSPVDSTQ